MSAATSPSSTIHLNQNQNQYHNIPVQVQPPRLVITPSTPCFPENIARSHRPISTPSYTHDCQSNTEDVNETRNRPIIPRTLDYEIDHSEKPTKRRSSSGYGYPSPHLLAPPLHTSNNTTDRRSTRSPIISIFFLVLSVVLVGSSMFCNTDLTGSYSPNFYPVNVQDPFGAGWLDGIMHLRTDHHHQLTNDNGYNGATIGGGGGGKRFLTTEEWRAYLGNKASTSTSKSASASRSGGGGGASNGKGAESWVGLGTMGLGDLYDFH